MPSRPTQQQIDLATTAWALSASRLAHDLLPALAKLDRRSGDGFSATSPGFGDGRGEPGSSPVERAALSRANADELARRAVRCYMALDRAHYQMQKALEAVITNDTTGESQITTAANEAGGFCVNCARHGVQSVRRPGSSSLCNPCYTYRVRNDQSERPGALVIAHERRRVVSYDRTHANRRRVYGPGVGV